MHLQWKQIIKKGFWALLSLSISAFILIAGIVIYFELQLPNVSMLKDVEMQVPLKIYTSDGKLIGEYGFERRNPVPLNQIPKQLVQAVLATEDQRYYDHPGVDIYGLIRSAIKLITTGHKVEGGSTITMQVARNFFLTHRKTFTYKLKDILLAIKIDNEFSKDKVLELYLNKIYLGNHAYGVAAAAEVYFGKPLNQLTLPELATLAGLPKAPSALNPIANPIAAKDRRDHVLDRLYSLGYINKATYEAAVATPMTSSYHGQRIQVYAPYVAEMVRDAAVEHYGDAAYTMGLNIYTTINSNLQHDANRAFRSALLSYDQRHGYRGPSGNLGAYKNVLTLTDWAAYLSTIPTINHLYPAAVTKVAARSVEAVTANGQIVTIPWQGLSWARKAIGKNGLGPVPTNASDILKVGDVIRVHKLVGNIWQLAQVPEVEGAFVALNPHDGAILGLVGGFDFHRSKFNRVTQAYLQPGSSFKPFFYSAALDKGYTLASLINDAPISIWDPGKNGWWKPQDDTDQFLGPTRLRVALAQSVNIVAIKLLRNIGVNYAINYASRFGFNPEQLPHELSLALGTVNLTPLEMATGYAVFANGGFKVMPFLIDHITNIEGQTIYQAQPKVACESCIMQNNQNPSIPNPNTPPANQIAPETVPPQIIYLMTSALHSVIENGTGWRARMLHRADLAGKTGTTNDEMDAWFSGFNSDIEATAWVGFDQPKSLHEYGAQAAQPMWIDFMRLALAGKPEATMPQPPDIITARIDATTGLLAPDSDTNAMYEFFRKGTVPTAFSASAPPSMNDNSMDGSTPPGTGPINKNGGGSGWLQPLF